VPIAEKKLSRGKREGSANEKELDRVTDSRRKKDLERKEKGGNK